MNTPSGFWINPFIVVLLLLALAVLCRLKANEQDEETAKRLRMAMQKRFLDPTLKVERVRKYTV